MKLKRALLGPLVVALVAFVSGGWLLQRGVAGESGAFQQARILEEVLNRISRDYVDQRPTEDLYRMAVDGLIRELGDPHTAFMTAEDYNALRVQTTGEYGGLGIQIAERDGWITVIAPLPGTPAERAGLLAGDRIIEVEGASTEGWRDEDAVKVLRGPRGTPVNITIARTGVDEPIRHTITREEIHVNSVPSAYMVEPGVGIARLTLFSETSTTELRAAINQLRSEGMRGLILDLRTNPGGLLDQGVSVSDLFLKSGQEIVETRARNPRDNVTFRASQPEVYEGMPIVVLVDEYSASAAEIVAGALQDHDRALVLGSTTFGKGSVQTLFPLSGGNFLKMTTGKWYTPSGRSIQVERSSNGDPTALVEQDAIGLDGQSVQTPATDTVARQEYRTTGGRVVFGGGGIVPDLLVTPDTLTAVEREFFSAVSKGGNRFFNVAFRYGVDYTQQNPGLRQNFEVTPQMRSEFFRRLVESGIEVSREQFDGARRLVDQRLGYDIALAKFGQAVAAQRTNRNDAVVRAAVEILRNSPDQKTVFGRAAARVQASR
ncbi:MAG: S41 family peptidase [Gemmatimonadetes bacterium]|nr:S41 family peptidase [Gemmatimonadota bacterium]